MSPLFQRRPRSTAKSPPPARPRFDPETVAFDWSGQDPMTLRQLCEGMFVPGATGAGKSSTTFRLATEALLRLGAGGVFTTTKPGDAEAYARIVERAGRWKSLIPFGPRWPARFNLLEYEMRRPGEGAGHPDNLAKLLGSLVELAYDTGRTGQGQDPYWRQKAEELVRQACWLLWLADESPSFLILYLLITSAPRGSKDLKSEKWQRDSTFWQVFQKARARCAAGLHAADLELSEKFWLLEHAGLASRTRSIIVSVATAALSPFLRDPLRTLFSTGTTICPEMAAEGAVFLLDLPVKMWNEQGRLAQCLFKLCFQRAIERRPETPNRRPVFLAIDEYQNFVAESDIGFAATARSAGVCTIYATQNLQILYAAFARAGGDGKHSTHALLGNLSTKVFHAQTDQETNQFAADLLGKVRKRFGHASVTIEPQIPLPFFGSARPVNAGSSEQLVYDVEPHEFATLQKGGPENRGMVTAIVFQNGRTFSSGRTWLPVAIRQEGS